MPVTGPPIPNISRVKRKRDEGTGEDGLEPSHTASKVVSKMQKKRTSLPAVKTTISTPSTPRRLTAKARASLPNNMGRLSTSAAPSTPGELELRTRSGKRWGAPDTPTSSATVNMTIAEEELEPSTKRSSYSLKLKLSTPTPTSGRGLHAATSHTFAHVSSEVTRGTLVKPLLVHNDSSEAGMDVSDEDVEVVEVQKLSNKEAAAAMVSKTSTAKPVVTRVDLAEDLAMDIDDPELHGSTPSYNQDKSSDTLADHTPSPLLSIASSPPPIIDPVTSSTSTSAPNSMSPITSLGPTSRPDSRAGGDTSSGGMGSSRPPSLMETSLAKQKASGPKTYKTSKRSVLAGGA